MFPTSNCILDKTIPRRHRRTPSQFIKHVLYEEERNKAFRAQEVLMTAENPLLKEQSMQHQISIEARKLKYKNLLEEKRVRLLHQNVDEIRQLDVQIKRAKTQKQLTEQKALKEEIRKKKAQDRLDECKRLKEESQRNMEIEIEKEKESVRMKAALRQDLLKQMEEKVKKRELEKEIVEKEYKDRRKFEESIQEDIKNEKQAKHEMQVRLHKDIDEFLRTVKIFKSKQISHDEEILRKQKEEIQKREMEIQIRLEKLKQEMKERAEHSERIGREVFELRKEKESRDELLRELLIEERVHKDNIREQSNFEEQAQRSKSLCQDFKGYFLRGQHEMQLKKEEERRAMKEQLNIFKELEKQDNERKNLKIVKDEKYRQDLLNTIKFKKWDRELEALQSKERKEQQLALEKKQQEEIEAEKLRLLKAQPFENLKFFPNKTISSEHRLLLGLTSKKT